MCAFSRASREWTTLKSFASWSTCGEASESPNIVVATTHHVSNIENARSAFGSVTRLAPRHVQVVRFAEGRVAPLAAPDVERHRLAGLDAELAQLGKAALEARHADGELEGADMSPLAT